MYIFTDGVWLNYLVMSLKLFLSVIIPASDRWLQEKPQNVIDQDRSQTVHTSDVYCTTGPHCQYDYIVPFHFGYTKTNNNNNNNNNNIYIYEINNKYINK